MKIFPAIDIKDKKCVRLIKGDFDNKTVYEMSPVEQAGKYKNHGVWAKPIWPCVKTIQGSVPTPYIFDDVCTWEESAEAIMYWYLMSNDQREKCGLEGRRWAMNEGGINSKNMCNQFIKAMDYTINNFIPEQGFGLFTLNDHVGNYQPHNSIGVEIPKIDIDKLKNEINTTVSKL